MNAADPTAPRILITRLSAVGDVIHTLPLISDLRKHFPKATIVWASQGGPATLLRDYPGLDEVIVVPRGYLKSWTTLRQLRAKLRSYRFDVSIDPQSLTKSAVLGWLSGAQQRIGFARPQGREAALLLNTTRVVPRTQHVVDQYRELLRPLVGAQPSTPARFDFPQRSFPMVAAFLAELPRSSSGYAVINPGAGWDSKLWPAPRFGDVARQLGERYGLPSVVVWSGDREHGWANEIATRAAGHAWVAPSTSLPELAELIRPARLCVASDTGPLHLAAAVSVPCVGLYGPTRPVDSGPYGPQNLAVQTYYHAGTARQRRSADNQAMCAISVSQVIAACTQILRHPTTSALPLLADSASAEFNAA